MSAHRRLPHHFGLARHLADLPRDRFVALARAWDVDGDESGAAARLYRRMTDAAATHQTFNSLPPATQAVLQHLAEADSPRGTSEILRRVPLADTEVTNALAALERLGIVWRVAAADRAAEGPLWQVPRDLQRVLRFTPPYGRSGGERNAPAEKATPSPPRPRPPPPRVLSGGQLSRLVTDWKLARDVPSAAAMRAFADHCGLALGVWILARRVAKPGPRSVLWQSLAGPARTEALARLWVVDDDAPHPIAAPARDAFWRGLLQIEPQTWYDFDDVARFVGGLAAADRPADHGIGRSEIERAATVLRWIGVVRLGRDRAGSVDPGVALELTDIGAGILRRRYVIPGGVGE